MGEAGLITIFGMLVIAPLMSIYERTQKFQRLSPVEQNLQRASHGFALMVFVLVVAIAIYGIPTGIALGILASIIKGVGGEPSWEPAAVLAVLFVYGLVRCIVGVRRSIVGGVRDGLLAVRAVVKFALGLAAFLYLEQKEVVADWTTTSMWAWGLWLILLAIAWWCMLTGAVRFVLTLGLRSRQRPPPLHPSPRGRARDASPGEAKAAMQGSGGRKISLDDLTF